MTLLIAVSESFLYLCFALLVGGTFLELLPPSVKPQYHIPKSVYIGSLYGVVIFSFGPVFLLWYSVALENPGMISLADILFSVEVGQVWLIIAFSSILLVLFLVFNEITTSKKVATITLIWSLYLIVMYTWIGHGASLSTVGFISQTLHLVAISLWVGILFIIAWFTISTTNWSTFLHWYTPLSIGCVSLLLISGFFLMQLIAPEYWNSWLLPYGEALLIKHLLFAVLISIAFINAFLLRTTMDRRWLRIETYVIFIIFLVTGWMGQQAPPHEVLETLQSEPISPLIALLSQTGSQPLPVTLTWNAYSLTFTGFSIVFLLSMVVSFHKKLPPLFYLFLSICWILTTFIALMTAL